MNHETDDGLFYKVIHNHNIERVRLRESALILYLGSVGVIFGLAFGESIMKEILLITTFLSLGVSIIIAQHHNLIGTLLKYLTDEFIPYYRNEHSEIPFWELSETRHKYANRDITQRLIGNLILICVPPIASLFLTHDLEPSILSILQTTKIWFIDIFITLVSIIVTWNSYKYRKELLDNTRNKYHNKLEI